MSWIEQLLAENKGLNGPYASQVSPVKTAFNPTGVGTGGTTAPATPQNDFVNAFIGALAQHLNSQDALKQGTTETVLHDPSSQYWVDKKSDAAFGGPLTFQSAGDRYNAMANHTGAYAPPDPGLAARQRMIAALGPQPDVEESGANRFTMPGATYSNPNDLAAFRARFANTPLAYSGKPAPAAQNKRRYAFQ